MKILLLTLLFTSTVYAETKYPPIKTAEEKGAEMVEGINWNIRRNAEIQDRLTYEDLRPPEKSQVQIQILEDEREEDADSDED